MEYILQGFYRDDIPLFPTENQQCKVVKGTPLSIYLHYCDHMFFLVLSSFLLLLALLLLTLLVLLLLFLL